MEVGEEGVRPPHPTRTPLRAALRWVADLVEFVVCCGMVCVMAFVVVGAYAALVPIRVFMKNRGEKAKR